MQSFPHSPGGHLWLTCNFITFWSKNLRSFWWFFVHFYVPIPPKYIKMLANYRYSTYQLISNFSKKVHFSFMHEFYYVQYQHVPCWQNIDLQLPSEIPIFSIKFIFVHAWTLSSFLFIHAEGRDSFHHRLSSCEVLRLHFNHNGLFCLLFRKVLTLWAPFFVFKCNLRGVPLE